MKRYNRILLGLAMYMPFFRVKKFLYQLMGAQIGKGVYLAPNVVINCEEMNSVKIGDNCSLGFGVQIRCKSITMDKDVKISGGVCIYGKDKVTIRSSVHIGQNVYLDCYRAVLLEEKVQIAPKAIILTHDSSRSYIFGEDIKSFEKILRECSYVGAGAIVLPGVNINKSAIIAAGAIVTRDVAEYTTVLGNPARVRQENN